MSLGGARSCRCIVHLAACYLPNAYKPVIIIRATRIRLRRKLAFCRFIGIAFVALVPLVSISEEACICQVGLNVGMQSLIDKKLSAPPQSPLTATICNLMMSARRMIQRPHRAVRAADNRPDDAPDADPEQRGAGRTTSSAGDRSLDYARASRSGQENTLVPLAAYPFRA